MLFADARRTPCQTVMDIHQRGTRAAQPLATTVTTGTLYFVTDENKTERANGVSWESFSDPTPPALLAQMAELRVEIASLRARLE